MYVWAWRNRFEHVWACASMWDCMCTCLSFCERVGAYASIFERLWAYVSVCEHTIHHTALCSPLRLRKQLYQNNLLREATEFPSVLNFSWQWTNCCQQWPGEIIEEFIISLCSRGKYFYQACVPALLWTILSNVKCFTFSKNNNLFEITFFRDFEANLHHVE